MTSQTWFTSDHHFGHHNIMEFSQRPWTRLETTYEEIYALSQVDPVTKIIHQGMNDGLIERWNALIRPQDDVYVIGDFMWDDRLLPEIVPNLLGNIFLIPGNHDSCWRARPKWRSAQKNFEDVGITVLDSQETIMISDTSVLMCHFPYSFTHRSDDKFSGNRPDDEGGWLIHGHTHSPERLKGKQIHVGVDAWDWKPVSEHQIARIIETGDAYAD